MRFGKVLFVAGLSALAMASGAQAKEWKTIRFGTDATYPPFESVDSSGKLVGFEVDYGMALCEKMKVTCTFQNQDWDGIIPALMANKFDVIMSSMNVTDERKKKVLFSDVYYSTPPVLVGQKDSTSDGSPDSLKGKTIGTQSSTIFAKTVEKYYKGSELKTYPGGDEPNLDLANGRLDYVINDQIVEQEFLKKQGKDCCKIVKTLDRDVSIMGPGVAAAFRPEDADLAAMLNKAIAEVDADGTYKKIEAKYFSDDIRGK